MKREREGEREMGVIQRGRERDLTRETEIDRCIYREGERYIERDIERESTRTRERGRGGDRERVRTTYIYRERC